MMRRFFGKLSVQVLIGVTAGIILGVFAPNIGTDLKPLGDVFIKRIKMVFAPIILATVVLGIARLENTKELGRVGARALIYFEVLSTFALALARWIGSVDRERLDQVLDGRSDPEDLQALYEGDDAASSLEETDLLAQRPKRVA